ncbi:MAG: hypothetical protein U0Q20_14330 [Mycobacterium sp.]
MSRRKVIFPPAEYWTNPERNTVNFDPATAGDLRRAGAFIKHHAYSSREGMNAILTEALEVKRANQFIVGILDTYDAIVPQLVTQTGQTAMVQMVLRYAEGEHDVPEEWCRAARFLIAYGEGDHLKMDKTIRETDDVSPTIIALLDVYAWILPTLHTPLGMSAIENGIRTLSGMEVEDSQ